MAVVTRFTRLDGGLRPPLTSLTALVIFSFLLCNLATADTNTEAIEVPGGILQVSWQDQFKSKQQAKIREWLKHSATSAATLYGTYVPKTNVLVHKATRGKGPVPWAHTVRGGPVDGVVFHVNPTKSLRQFKMDWTATHEFSHLYLPYIGRRDIWLSEGFASYYQHVLMMRQGTLTPKQGWQQFKKGLDRGAADPHQTGSLADTSEQMRQNRAFKRVYWTGAIFFLGIDLELRKSGSSLDEVVAKFNQCCRYSQTRWNGETLMAQFDRAAGSDVFSTKYQEFLTLQGFPDYRDLLLELGISYKGKKIKFEEEQNPLRDAIIKPPS